MDGSREYVGELAAECVELIGAISMPKLLNCRAATLIEFQRLLYQISRQPVPRNESKTKSHIIAKPSPQVIVPANKNNHFGLFGIDGAKLDSIWTRPCPNQIAANISDHHSSPSTGPFSGTWAILPRPPPLNSTSPAGANSISPSNVHDSGIPNPVDVVGSISQEYLKEAVHDSGILNPTGVVGSIHPVSPIVDPMVPNGTRVPLSQEYRKETQHSMQRKEPPITDSGSAISTFHLPLASAPLFAEPSNLGAENLPGNQSPTFSLAPAENNKTPYVVTETPSSETPEGVSKAPVISQRDAAQLKEYRLSLLTQACWSELSCPKGSGCLRVHGKFEPTQDARFKEQWRPAVSGDTTPSRHKGHAVCRNMIINGSCASASTCTFRHFDKPPTLTNEQRDAFRVLHNRWKLQFTKHIIKTRKSDKVTPTTIMTRPPPSPT